MSSFAIIALRWNICYTRFESGLICQGWELVLKMKENVKRNSLTYQDKKLSGIHNENYSS